MAANNRAITTGAGCHGLKIRVLHLITKLEFGGAQQNTLYTAAHLDKERFEVVLACGRGGYLDTQAESIQGIKKYWLRFLKREVRPWWDLLAFFEIWLLCLRIKPHIIHTHSSKAGILGRWAAWAAGVPVIIHTYHGFGFHDRQPALLKWLYILLEHTAAAITCQLIYVSYDNMAYAARHGIQSAKPPVLIRSGVEPPQGRYPLNPEQKKEKRRSLGLPEDATIVTMVGNLKAQKNPAHFLELARRTDPSVLFLFIGGAESPSPYMADFQQGRMPANVRFLNWRRDASEIVAASDIFLLTSLWEGLPRSAVEALWRGIPVCAYATDGLKEIVREGENGYLATPGDIDALESRLKSLLQDNQKRREMADRAVSSIGPEFDIRFMVQRQETLYQELIQL